MASFSRSAQQWLMLVVPNLTVPAIVAWKVHVGEAGRTAAMASAFVSLLIINGAIVLAVRSRNKRLGSATPRGFCLGAACLALVSGLITTAILRSVAEHNEYVDLALSDTPLDEIQPKQKALVVELVRRRAAASKAYEKLASQMRPISPALYSPDSFANENVIRSVSEQYKNAYDTDLTYHMQVAKNWSDFREKMLKVDPDYLRSFEASFQRNNERDGRVFQLEQQCVTATLALYEYAGIHSRQITLTDGQLHFVDKTVRAEFNRQLEESKSLYERWQSVLQETLRTKQQSRKELGISPNAGEWP